MFGERLRETRKRAGLLQVDLAVALGDRYDHSMISRVESGHKSLRLDGAVNAARELGVSLDYLVGLTDDPTPYAELEKRLAKAEAQVIRPGPVIVESDVLHDKDDAEGIEILTEVAASAGSGAEVYDETATGRVPFRRSWLRRHGIKAADCHIISIRGDSMDPTLPDGCSVIVDRSRREPVDGHIYVMRTADGLVVKRLRQDEKGWWQVVSDNPELEPVPLNYGADIIGEVRWMAKTL